MGITTTQALLDKKSLAYIRNHLPADLIFNQLAEECCELAQAAHKASRLITVKNPTPRTSDSVIKNLREELTDVLLVCALLGIHEDGELANAKLERWCGRVSSTVEMDGLHWAISTEEKERILHLSDAPRDWL